MSRRQPRSSWKNAVRQALSAGQLTPANEQQQPPPEGVSPLAYWPSPAPENYLGQLRDEFQAALAAERAGLRPEDCRFYHCIELPDGEVIHGPWDLRGREAAYLGNVELAGRRVLECGPSSGYLTFWMEKQGAEVVGFDAGFETSVDLLPVPRDDTRKLHLDHFRMTYQFQHSWWYLHRRLASGAKKVYGNIYNMPDDIGTFDVATFGALLVHLRSPIQALEQAARRTTSTIIVTDVWTGGSDTLHENIMRPFPAGEGSRWVLWWELSAGAVVAMLGILGFRCREVLEHTQLHQYGHVQDAPYLEVPMYTVVADRE